jgi:cytosine/adenosine deaminase-related metal-dependent hydrolase
MSLSNGRWTFFSSLVRREEFSCPEATILVRAGHLVPTHDQPVIQGGAVAVAGEKIEAVGAYEDLLMRYPKAERIGGDQFFLILGLINGHGHGRGLTDFQRGALDNTLESWLLDTRKYVPVSAYDDIAYSAARLLKLSVTTAMHNHILKDPTAYHQEFAEGLKAHSDAGLRVQFNPGVRNDNPFVYGDNKAFLAALPESLRTVLTTPPPPGSLSAPNLEPGRLADMVLLDYQKMCHPFVDPSHDPIDVLLYRGSGQDVHTVMVNGRVVVQDGQLLTIDEDAVATRLGEEASQPRTEKEETFAEAIEELKRHVIRFYEGWTEKVRLKAHFHANSQVDGDPPAFHSKE